MDLHETDPGADGRRKQIEFISRNFVTSRMQSAEPNQANLIFFQESTLCVEIGTNCAYVLSAMFESTNMAPEMVANCADENGCITQFVFLPIFISRRSPQL